MTPRRQAAFRIALRTPIIGAILDHRESPRLRTHIELTALPRLPLQRRNQLAALPWRDGPAGREVLLITSRGRRQWLAPKGKPMPGLSAAEAAAEEAWEEAGVRGEIAEFPIGAFLHRKGSAFARRHMQVDLYPLRVTSQAEHWPEAHERERRWVSVAVALRLVRSPGLRDLIALFGELPKPRRRDGLLSMLRGLAGSH